MSVKRLTLLSLFTTISLAVFAIESAIPPLIPIPGIKLGLANIVTLVLLRHFSRKDALAVLSARILLSTLLFGQALSLMYSAMGGLCSLLVMAAAVKALRKKYAVLVGAVGGLTHNMGQLLAALLITSVPGVLAYTPYLVLSGILAGLFTGLCACLLDKYLIPHLPFLI